MDKPRKYADWFRLGFSAGADGETSWLVDCPYQPGSRAAEAWKDGLFEALRVARDLAAVRKVGALALRALDTQSGQVDEVLAQQAIDGLRTALGS